MTPSDAARLFEIVATHAGRSAAKIKASQSLEVDLSIDVAALLIDVSEAFELPEDALEAAADDLVTVGDLLELVEAQEAQED